MISMMSIKFKDSEKYLEEIQDVFNEMLEGDNTALLDLNHYELWRKSGKRFTPEEWKKFRLNEGVDQWYAEELLLIAKTKESKLIRSAGDNKSVAETQALNQISAFIERNQSHVKDTTIFIYSFIPLNKEEEQSPNARIINNIPTEIENAIIKVSRDSVKK